MLVNKNSMPEQRSLVSVQAHTQTRSQLGAVEDGGHIKRVGVGHSEFRFLDDARQRQRCLSSDYEHARGEER